MAHDVPNSNGDFNCWHMNEIALAADNATISMAAGDISALQTAHTEWDANHNDHVSKQRRGAAGDAQRAERDIFGDLLRSHGQPIQSGPGRPMGSALGMVAPSVRPSTAPATRLG